jgi:hypothetical protein
VPNWVELEVKSMSGGLEMSDMAAFCRIRNNSGSIKLSRLHKGFQLKGSSGNFEGQELGGRVTIKQAHGNVRLANCRMSGLDLVVTSGNIAVDTVLSDGADSDDYRINGTNGQIRFRLPSDSRASLECRSLNGRIATGPEFGPSDYRNRPGQSRLKTDLNGGGRKVNISTINGSIDLGIFDPARPESAGTQAPWPTPPAPPVAPKWPTPPAPPTPPMPPAAGPNIRYRPPVMNNSADTGASQPQTPNPVIITPAPVQASAANEARQAPAVSEQSQPTPVQTEAATPKSAGQTDKNQRQLEILKAIEHGEMSVEEGLNLLNGLEA